MELRLPSTLEFPAHMRLTTHYFRLCLFLCLPSRRPSLGAGFFSSLPPLWDLKAAAEARNWTPPVQKYLRKLLLRDAKVLFCIVYHDISDTPEFLSQHISV